MNNPAYCKYCIVPECKNTSKKTPKKLFLNLPNNKEVRKQWLTLAGRSNCYNLTTVSRMYFCEDHFDLPNDMINYMEYYIMGKVSHVRLKPGCTPKKFECQEDWKKRKCHTEPPYVPKKKGRPTIAKCLNILEQSNAPSPTLKHTSDQNVQTDAEKEEEIVCKQTADKATVTEQNTRNTADKATVTEQNTRNTADKATVTERNTRNKSVQTKSKSRRQNSILKTVEKIEKKPQLYTGVPAGCYYLIDIIEKELNIPKHHLLLCLNKIRLNDKLNQLSDDYGMTPSCIIKLIFEKIPLIASALRPFIMALDGEITKRTIPVPFRQKFYDVSCIIHCLEIEIQKPLKAVNQARTWSDSKKAYTIKYLISCSPNGLVNYISPGFGGGTTDTRLVESCGFVKTLKSGVCIMADKGFENLEQYLMKSFILVVRPPGDMSGVEMCKSEAIISKQIANLRTHVERVDRCLHEFCMLQPHACIHFKFAEVLDDIVVIACALINLQCKL